jgi:NAD(P)-dependent dehydrogenase (short-subunit alcohol dehydrogenase family)
MNWHPPKDRTVLIVGVSRGLGLGMTRELLGRGWRVIGTTRGTRHAELHDLADRSDGRLEVMALDMDQPDQIASLRGRLEGRQLDALFVNAGATNADPSETIGQVATDEFIRVMVTNALSPMRVIEGLDDLVTSSGTIGVMSSGQGSITDNTRGGREVYRGTKAALNMYMRSYAARQVGSARPLLLLAPGWIRTALGGPDAPYTLEESIPKLVDVLLAQEGKPGLRYLDRDGNTVPW